MFGELIWNEFQRPTSDHCPSDIICKGNVIPDFMEEFFHRKPVNWAWKLKAKQSVSFQEFLEIWEWMSNKLEPFASAPWSDFQY